MLDLPVADPWWIKTSFDDAITLLSEPHVHPLLRCNVWHVVGRTTDMVVDTSLGLAPLIDWVTRHDAGGIMAVATHSHSDHVGGMHEFTHRVGHCSEAEVMREPIVSWLDTSVYDDTVLGPYRDAGYDIPAVFIDAMPPNGVAATVITSSPAPLTRLVDHGDMIDLGDRTFEVLHLPGHSPGSIGLWEAATGTLFSGDAAYDGPLLDELDGANIDHYIASLELLRELPVDVVHGGHETSFGRERLVAICDHYLRRWHSR